jgi:hypothetical protein
VKSRSDVVALDPSLDAGDSTLVAALHRLSPWEPFAWLIALVGLLLDILLTVYGLSLGLSELNPFARHLMTLLSPVSAMVLLKSLALVVGVAGWLVLPRVVRAAVPVCLAVPWWIAVVINARAIAALV